MGRLIVVVVVSLWVIPLSFLVNHIVPEPYMDEIFHVPQAQQYCRGNFMSWDPMITTPPGLYCLSLAHVASLFPGMFLARMVKSFAEACSCAILRSINGVLAVLCSVLFYDIIYCLRPSIDDKKASLIAIVMTLYPLHWFFTFLYYTDVASLGMVMAMYYMSLRKKNMWSALIGAASVFIRQTNIIWVCFVACTGVIELALSRKACDVGIQEITQYADKVPDQKNLVRSSNLRRRKRNGAMNSQNNYNKAEKAYSQAPSTGLYDEFWLIIQNSWHRKQKILTFLSPYLFVLIAFLAFVHWNGSIVLGAKDSHVVSPHFAQILYFGLISSLFTLPMHLKRCHAHDLYRTCRKNLFLSLFLALTSLIASLLAVRYFSIEHPYLLADNRHYTFYLWRRFVIRHWLIKYLLLPVYICSWFSILCVLVRTQRKIWTLAYFLATAAVLIPAPLIEFRYFTIPFYIFMLNCRTEDNWSWFLTGALYICINIFTMAMFLFQPFSWTHEPGVQRFIW